MRRALPELLRPDGAPHLSAFELQGVPLMIKIVLVDFNFVLFLLFLLFWFVRLFVFVQLV